MPPMDAPQLRPLGVGDIVDRVFALYRARPLLFIALAAVPYLLLVVVIAIVGVAFAVAFSGSARALSNIATATTADLRAMAPAITALIVFGLIVAVAAIVILSAQTGALVDGMASRYLARATTFAVAFRRGLAAAPRLIATGLLIFLIFIALWIPLVVVMILANQALVVVVAGLAGVVATVYFFVSMLVAPVVATLEGVGPITAIRRSWSLA